MTASKSNDQNSGQVTWTSPSNIALVKYWGKHGIQLPRNPSLSFTLKNALTETTVRYQKLEKESGKTVSLDFLFEGKTNPQFGEKIAVFLAGIIDHFPWLSDYHFQIESRNSFPHSTGIASSASAMSVLAMCLCSIENELTGNLSNHEEFLNKASYIARLGSGSASRSVYPDAAIWGKLDSVPGSSDEFAIPLPYDLHGKYHNYQDSILIVSSETKKTSSRAGHKLMEGNPYAQVRYKQATRNLETLNETLQNGDLEQFGKIVESEALTLHALMMCSEPSFILMKPNTLVLIDKIRAFREETKQPVYFTLDAGPNIHLLYPASAKQKVTTFIESDLKPFCERILYDEMGPGPIQIA